MLHIFILTNIKNYAYHTPIASQIQSYLESRSHNVTILDIDSEKYDHQCFAKVKENNPDVVITLDLAGFRFRTQSGEIALNQLYSKNLNLTWGNKPEYGTYLNKKISLSQLFYDVAGTDCHLSDSYPNVLYYHVANPLSVSQMQPLLSEKTQEVFTQIWSDFTTQVLLPEA